MPLEWLDKQFLYYTEVQLATTERVFSLSRASKAERRRHQSISEEMVKVCAQIIGTGAAKWEQAKRMAIPRLIEKLEQDTRTR